MMGLLLAASAHVVPSTTVKYPSQITDTATVQSISPRTWSVQLLAAIHPFVVQITTHVLTQVIERLKEFTVNEARLDFSSRSAYSVFKSLIQMMLLLLWSLLMQMRRQESLMLEVLRE